MRWPGDARPHVGGTRCAWQLLSPRNNAHEPCLRSHSQHLGRRVAGHDRPLLAREEAEAHTRAHAARTTSALLRRSLSERFAGASGRVQSQRTEEQGCKGARAQGNTPSVCPLQRACQLPALLRNPEPTLLTHCSCRRRMLRSASCCISLALPLSMTNVTSSVREGSARRGWFARLCRKGSKEQASAAALQGHYKSRQWEHLVEALLQRSPLTNGDGRLCHICGQHDLVHTLPGPACQSHGIVLVQLRRCVLCWLVNGAACFMSPYQGRVLSFFALPTSGSFLPQLRGECFS